MSEKSPKRTQKPKPWKILRRIDLDKRDPDDDQKYTVAEAWIDVPDLPEMVDAADARKIIKTLANGDQQVYRIVQVAGEYTVGIETREEVVLTEIGSAG